MTKEQRDIIGFMGWMVLTIPLSLIITLPAMILREMCQYHKYLEPCGLNFEIDDVYRYSIAILIGQYIQATIIFSLL